MSEMHSPALAFAPGVLCGTFHGQTSSSRSALAGRQCHARRSAPCRVLAFAAAGAGHQEAVDFPAGSVALVGTGPGAGGLLTLRGAALISMADVIVHDRLGCEAALAHATPPAELVAVGKGRGVGTGSQARICEELVRQAMSGMRVVRLKGGDPLTFGRGGDEIAHLRASGVPVQVCPGVTAAAGAAAALQLPLTHARLSRAVRLVTAHDARTGLASAAAADTVVLYMALRELPAATDALAEAGVPPGTPAVAVQDATLPGQRQVWSCLKRLAADVADAELVSPTIVIVGDVVGLSPGWTAWAGQVAASGAM